MAKKGGAAGGDTGGSKKAQGQARKADAAAGKAAEKNKQAEAAEAEKWDKGSKSNAKAWVTSRFVLNTSLTSPQRGRRREGRRSCAQEG
jgi:hypothetical protein